VEYTAGVCCVLESLPSAELKKMRRKQRKAELKAQAKLQEEKKGLVCVCM